MLLRVGGAVVVFFYFPPGIRPQGEVALRAVGYGKQPPLRCCCELAESTLTVGHGMSMV